MVKRLLSILLCLVMLFSFFPVSSLAAENEQKLTPTGENTASTAEKENSSVNANPSGDNASSADNNQSADSNPQEDDNQQPTLTPQNGEQGEAEQNGESGETERSAQPDASEASKETDEAGEADPFTVYDEDGEAVGSYSTLQLAYAACPVNGTIALNSDADGNCDENSWHGLSIDKAITVDLCAHKLTFIVPSDFKEFTVFYSTVAFTLKSTGGKGVITADTSLVDCNDFTLNAFIISEDTVDISDITLDGKFSAGLLLDKGANLTNCSLSVVDIGIVCRASTKLVDCNITSDVVIINFYDAGNLTNAVEIMLEGGSYSAGYGVFYSVLGETECKLIAESAEFICSSTECVDFIILELFDPSGLVTAHLSDCTVTGFSFDNMPYSTVLEEQGEPIYVYASDIPYVWKIGSAEYTDLQSAIDAAATGDVIALQKDYELNLTSEDPCYAAYTVPSGKNITIDLNGHLFSATAAADIQCSVLILNCGTLKIIDSGTDPENPGIMSLDLNTTNQSDTTDETDDDSFAATILNLGSLTLKSGSLSGDIPVLNSTTAVFSFFNITASFPNVSVGPTHSFTVMENVSIDVVGGFVAGDAAFTVNMSDCEIGTLIIENSGSARLNMSGDTEITSLVIAGTDSSDTVLEIPDGTVEFIEFNGDGSSTLDLTLSGGEIEELQTYCIQSSTVNLDITGATVNTLTNYCLGSSLHNLSLSKGTVRNWTITDTYEADETEAEAPAVSLEVSGGELFALNSDLSASTDFELTHNGGRIAGLEARVTTPAVLTINRTGGELEAATLISNELNTENATNIRCTVTGGTQGGFELGGTSTSKKAIDISLSDSEMTAADTAFTNTDGNLNNSSVSLTNVAISSFTALCSDGFNPFSSIVNTAVPQSMTLPDGVSATQYIDDLGSGSNKLIKKYPAEQTTVASSISDAFDYNNDTRTYTLKADVNYGTVDGNKSITVVEDTTVTIDLNGHTLEADIQDYPLVYVKNNGIFYVIDSSQSKAGLIKINSAKQSTEYSKGAPAIFNESGHTIIASGSVESVGICVAANSGQISVSNDGYRILSYNASPIVSNNASVNITSGKICAIDECLFSLSGESTSLNITGGQLCSLYRAGEIYCAKALSSGTNGVSVSGGTFYNITVPNSAAKSGKAIHIVTESELYDENGNEEYPLPTEYAYKTVNAWFFRSDNTYDQTKFAARLLKISVIKDATANGPVEVQNPGAVSIFYDSLNTAISNAEDGATIILNADVINADSHIPTVSKSLTIDFNTHAAYRQGLCIKNSSTDPITVVLKNGRLQGFNSGGSDSLITQRGNCQLSLENMTVETDILCCLGSSSNSCTLTLKNSTFISDTILREARKLCSTEEEIIAAIGNDYYTVLRFCSVGATGNVSVENCSFSNGIMAFKMSATNTAIKQYSASDAKPYDFLNAEKTKAYIISYLKNEPQFPQDAIASISTLDAEDFVDRLIFGQYIRATLTTEEASLIFDVKPCVLFSELALEIPIPNSSLKSSDITFTLPIPTSFITDNATKVYVQHKSDSGDLLDEGSGLYEIKQDPETGACYVEINSSSFSPFVVTLAKDVIEPSYEISLNLDESIGVLFYLSDLDDGISISDYTLAVTYKGNTSSIPDSSFTDLGDGCYSVQLAQCSADEIYENIGIDVYQEDVKLKHFNYSVYTYCTNMLNKDETAEELQNNPRELLLLQQLKELCRSVLDYGTYSKSFFNYQETAPVAGEYTARRLSGVVVDGPVAEKTGKTTGITAASASLSLNSKLTVNFYFTLSASANPDSYTFSCGGQSVSGTFRTETDGRRRIKVEIDGIAPVDFDKSIEVTVTNTADSTQTVISYSPLTYAMTQQTSTIAGLPEICRALYRYNNAAKAYFNLVNSAE